MNKKENIWNIPNILTFSRVIITFVVIYFIFAGFSIFHIMIAFFVGMLTDCLDGQIARRYNLTTEFGRKFDMVSDRFLFTGTVFSLVIKFTSLEILSRLQLLQIFLISSREIIASPAVFITILWGKVIPGVRSIGKATTVMQAIALPLILLSTRYEVFGFSIYIAILTGIMGVISAFYYIQDLNKKSENSGT